MSYLDVAVVQCAPTADVAANRTAVSRFVADAAARGAKLVVFPEYMSYFVDPLDASLASHAEKIDGPFVSFLREVAHRHGVTIVAGMIESCAEHEGEPSPRVHNTLVAVAGTGLRAAYRKQHLYDAFGARESDWIRAGRTSAPMIFDVDGVSCGMMTCYDLRFPELARAIAVAGAELLLVPAEWVRGPLKEHHWETLTTARAIENTVYLAGADHPPPLGVGRSVVVDPQGVAVAAMGTGSGVLMARVDKEHLAHIRRTNPSLTLRRYDVAPAS